MRKISTPLIALLIFLVSCQKENLPNTSPENTDDGDGVQTVITKRSCGAYDVLLQQMAADPALASRMDAIETYTQKVIRGEVPDRLVNGVITIPVVVHVVYKTTAQNISDAQVQSQIDVLNEDYANTNADKSKIPSLFKPVDGTVGIRFTLDRIIRKKTTKKSFTTNDAVKKSANGGDNAIDATTYLNMWACNLGQGLLGYAQFPGGNVATDGVVILYSAFGRTGNLIPTYNLGRTATHEVGHWLNLRHIWGDANCGNDLVNDTPVANTANYGCPSYPHLSTCTGKPTEMTMNYMDYTDDACMYMFSSGQSARISAVFAPGGPRSKMAL
ncbi:MAG: zinc metalloprotease [Ginsengibacter sp.]